MDTLLAFVKKVVPTYRGRKARLNVSDRPMSLLSVWFEGSRDTFYGVNLATGELVTLPVSSSPFQPLKSDYIPQPGIAVLEHSIFCGKDVGFRVHVHPDDAASFRFE